MIHKPAGFDFRTRVTYVPWFYKFEVTIKCNVLGLKHMKMAKKCQLDSGRDSGTLEKLSDRAVRGVERSHSGGILVCQGSNAFRMHF